jgi:hypothetical protein
LKTRLDVATTALCRKKKKKRKKKEKKEEADSGGSKAEGRQRAHTVWDL